MNLLENFFNSKSDSNQFLEASQQEKLEKEFGEWVRLTKEVDTSKIAMENTKKITLSDAYDNLSQKITRLKEEVLENSLCLYNTANRSTNPIIQGENEGKLVSNNEDVAEQFNNLSETLDRIICDINYYINSTVNIIK